MPRHRFDPFAAVLGLVLIGLAVAVASFELDGIEDNVVLVVAGAAVLVALLIIPWRRDAPDAPDTSGRIGEVIEQ